MAKTNITRNPGESEADYWRRYRREYAWEWRAKQPPKAPKERKKPEPKGPGRAGPKYNIVRREGEAQAEFDKRYARERQRINRARAKGADPDISCEILVKGPRKGLDIPREEWEALRRQPGESEEEWRRREQRARDRRYAKRHPGIKAQRSRARYEANPEAEKARSRAYVEANREKVRAASSAYYWANRGRRQALLAKWRAENPERLSEVRKRWYDENRALRNYYSSAWRKQARIATPPWADAEKMQAIYAEAIRVSEETGIEHHVDHFYPLRGRTVSGLHCEANLRIIPATENMRKHNRHPDEF